MHDWIVKGSWAIRTIGMTIIELIRLLDANEISVNVATSTGSGCLTDGIACSLIHGERRGV